MEGMVANQALLEELNGDHNVQNSKRYRHSNLIDAMCNMVRLKVDSHILEPIIISN